MTKAVAPIAEAQNEQFGASERFDLSSADGLPVSRGSSIIPANTPATLSPVSTGDAHNWRVFIA